MTLHWFQKFHMRPKAATYIAIKLYYLEKKRVKVYNDAWSAGVKRNINFFKFKLFC